MKRLIYLPVAAAMLLVQSSPLGLVAWLGRQLGTVAWLVDGRRRRLARENLQLAFGDELDDPARRRLARENFSLLGESFLCALRTSVMHRDELSQRLQVVGLNKLTPWIDRTDTPGIVIATGHFANIEMYAHASRDLPWMRAITMYQQSPSWLLARILDRVRRDAPCEFFEQRRDRREMRAALRDGNVIIGLMADTSPGPRGYAVPFFGRPASTSPMPALHARRLRMPLHAAVCYRTGPGRWRIEISDEIPTRIAGRARPLLEVLTDLNAHLEHSIRRQPASWFWMQPRWQHAGRIRRRPLMATGT